MEMEKAPHQNLAMYKSYPIQTPRYAVVVQRKKLLVKRRRGLQSIHVCTVKRMGENEREIYASYAREATGTRTWKGKRLFFSKETKIVDVSSKDRAARPLANKCYVRVRRLDGSAGLS